MNQSPRVSIGLPVYNGARYLPAAVDSIRAQTFEDFELIICDNDSTDETEEICRRYAQADSRIRYYRQPKNLGAAPNYNSALARARAPYFRWACHDDLLAPTNLEQCVDVLDSSPNVVLVAPRTVFIDERGATTSEPEWGRRLSLRSEEPSARLAQFLNTYRWGGCGTQLFGLMRTEILRHTAQHGDYPSADFLLIAEMALRGQVAEVRKPLFKKRNHAENSVRSNEFQADKIAEWFDSSNKGKGQWLEVRWLTEFGKAIWNAPLTLTERKDCYRVLVSEYALPHARKVAEELVMNSIGTLSLGRYRPVRKVQGFETSYTFSLQR